MHVYICDAEGMYMRYILPCKVALGLFVPWNVGIFSSQHALWVYYLMYIFGNNVCVLWYCVHDV